MPGLRRPDLDPPDSPRTYTSGNYPLVGSRAHREDFYARLKGGGPSEEQLKRRERERHPRSRKRRPLAQFSGTPLSGPAPLLVTFTDESLRSPESWSWEFGDSGTSNDQNPTHTYNDAGTYSVKLTVTSRGSNSLTKANYITAT